MATVTIPTGEKITESDPTVLDYYRGEGYVVVDDAVDVPDFPRVFDGEKYVGEELVELPVINDGDEFVAGAPDDGTHGEVLDADVSGQVGVGIDAASELTDAGEAAQTATEALADTIRSTNDETLADETAKPRRR